MKALSGLGKTGIVIAGYIAAILVAMLATWIYVSFTSGVDRQTYGAMYDFGDMLLFVAVFGVFSTIPTALAFMFLRQNRAFWTFCCVTALAIASTAIGAVVSTLIAKGSYTENIVLFAWAGLAFPRIFLSPFFAASFGLAGMFAPERRFRWLLFGAAVMEAIASIFGFFHWFAPLWFR